MSTVSSNDNVDRQQIIITIDVGSSSVRSSAYALHSRGSLSPSMASASRPQRSVQPNTGRVVLNGVGDCPSVMDLVDQCIDETLQELRERFDRDQWEVLGIGFSTFVMNLVGVSADGEVVGEEASISYACNTAEVAEEVQALKRELGDEVLENMYQQTGAPVHAAYALAQLRILYADPNLAQVCQSIHKWQTIASVCLSRWTGQQCLPISFSEASWTGLLNHRLCEYENTVLALLPEACCQALPELSDFDDQSVLADGITNASSYWDRWPELRTTRFFLGLGDGACANVGSKCSTPSRIACTVGTTAAARVVLRSPVGSDAVRVPPGLFCYRIDRSHVLIGGALTDGGSVVEWVSQLLNLSTEEAFRECLQKVEELAETDLTAPGQSGSLTVVPFLSGERSTGFRSRATGGILGITRETTPAHLFKSCLEGVTLRIAAIVKLIQKTVPGETVPRIIASGKALEVNALWRQMLSDSTGLDVVFDADTEEGTSRGVASLVSMALAMSKAGATESTVFLGEEPVQNSLVSNPRDSGKEYWHRATANQDSFIEAISPLFMLT